MIRSKRSTSATAIDALAQVVRCWFDQLRLAHPDWSIDTLFSSLRVPQSQPLIELAYAAGFMRAGAVTRRDENRLLQLLSVGVGQVPDLARQTGIAPDKIEAFIDQVGLPYGMGAWGETPWGGPARPAAGSAPVSTSTAASTSAPTSAPYPFPKAIPRRISPKGQFTLRGHVYSLGVE